MARIALRVYNQEIETLIDNGQIDQAIAHCRHILKVFPKHVDTYRLLGKAYLESQRYSDAADILQRVLSAIPYDFVAHLGMSIIREDEGNLDQAIWHMERAFEVQPSNAAIQDELRRLFGRRDGMEPPKVRLTRGALARMYAKGDLYPQAVAELRAALAEDPERIDLQVLLGKVYAQAGMQPEAAEICNQVLRKLPFSLDANEVMAQVAGKAENDEKTEVYRHRIYALDPYTAHTTPQTSSAAQVNAEAVTLEKFEWHPGAAVEESMGQPEWASALGVEVGGFSEPGQEQLPDWLTGAAEPARDQWEAPDAESPTSRAAEAGLAAAGIGAAASWASETFDSREDEAASKEEAAIPEWMQEAGWAPSQGEAVEGPVDFDEPDTETAGEEAAVSADIPEWLREMAPETGAEPDPETETDEIDQSLLAWLDSGALDNVTAEQAEAAGVSAEEGLVEEGLVEEGLVEEGLVEEQPDDEPEPAAEAGSGLPAWLVDAEDETPWSGAAVFPGPVEAGEIAAPAEPDQTEAASEWVQAGESEPDEESEAVPDWLQFGEGVEDTPAVTEAGSDLPEWLREFDAGKEQPMEWDEPDLEAQQPAEARSAWEGAGDWDEAPEAPAEPAAGAVEGLEAGLEEGLEEGREEGLGAGLETGMPEWMASMLPEERQEAQDDTAQEETAPVAPVEPIPDWLKNLAEEDLIEGDTQPTRVSPAEPAELEAEAAPDVPGAAGWGAQVFPFDAETEVSEAETELEEAPVSETEDASQELFTAGAQVFPVEPVEAAAIETEQIQEVGAAETGAEMDQAGEAGFEAELGEGEDMDAAFAWLESLAVKQGADEALLLTPEERQDTPPEWVQEAQEAGELEAEQDSELEQALESLEPEAVESETWPSGGQAWEASQPEEQPAVESTPAEEPAAEPEQVPAEARMMDVPEETGPEVPEAAAAADSAVPDAGESEERPELPDWLAGAEEGGSTGPLEWTPPPLEQKPVRVLDLNQASLIELERLPGVGFIMAQAIVNHRETYGPFASVDDLDRVPGFNPGAVDEMRAYLFVHTPEPAEKPEPARPAPESERAPLPQSEAAGPVLAARSFLAEGNTQEAAQQYAGLVRKREHIPEVLVDLEEAVQRFPDDFSLWQALGDAYLRSDQLQQALQAYEKAEALL